MQFKLIVLRTTIINYDVCSVNRKYQNFRLRNLAKWALTCYGGSIHERLLSESSRP